MVYLKVFFYFLFVSLFFKTTQANEKFYEEINLGEFEHKDFYGPISPDFYLSNALEKVVYKDQEYFDDFFKNEGTREFFRLEKFIQQTLPDEYLCPNQNLAVNIDYAHYLYRLIHLSFLIESLKLNSQLIQQIENEDNFCAPTWEKLFKNCHPQGDEMSKFITRSKDYLVKNPFKPKNLSTFINSSQLLKSLENPVNSYQRYFEHEYEANCLEKNCVTSNKDFLQLLKKSCQSKYEIIENICSEKDNYGTLSVQPKMTELIYLSNASVVINQGGYGRGCLDRFKRLNKHKERVEPYLKKSFVDIAQIIQEENRPYLQGDLFLPGALKEFDDKGLVGFLFVPSQPTDLDILNSPTIPTIELNSIETQKLEISETSKKNNSQISIKQKVSYFATQVERRKELGVNSLEINMEEFDQDFVFQPDVIKNLSLSLAKFQTQRAIQDMKVHDKIGSVERALSLLYLKFLLNAGEHQSLFNLTYIVGNSFYVENDIDQKKEPILISLKSDYRNRFGWQIYILAP